MSDEDRRPADTAPESRQPINGGDPIVNPVGGAKPVQADRQSATPSIGQGQQQESIDAAAQAVLQILHEALNVAGAGADKFKQVRTSWAMGHEPRTKEEWNFEFRLRESQARFASDERIQAQQAEQIAAVEAQRAQQIAAVENERTRVIHEHLRQLRRGDWVRSLALFIVVAAIVAMPFWAIIRSFSPKSTPAEFAQYIAPITGIAGAVIGYWFGNRSDTNTPQITDLLRPSQASSFQPKSTMDSLSRVDHGLVASIEQPTLTDTP